MSRPGIEDLCINTIRFLAADAIQHANSGHPGMPMGAAAMAFALWTRHLKFDPADPMWPDRDRFVLSAGHASMLLYSLLHLAGYDLTLDELRNFRQWESRTPGHPEYGMTPGVETTSGPLGQGFGVGVGMAIAVEHLAAMYNRPGFPIVDHFIYGIVSDGDLMEGVSHEAASLAGHLKLGRLVYLYDDNRITIDGSTDLTFTEDRAARFRAYGWHVDEIGNGNDVAAVSQAIGEAKRDPRPSLIICRTHIGYGLPTKQDTASAHGEPPGEEELEGAKRALGWPLEPRFLVPEEVRSYFRQVAAGGATARKAWEASMAGYRQKHAELAAQFDRTCAGALPPDLADRLPAFEADTKGMATRVASGKSLNALATAIPELIGGSADLTGSNKTNIDGESPFTASNRAGRYLHLGIREHGMGALLSGLALHGGLIPYGGTFLVFSDYMRPAIRLAAMMQLRVVYVLTHDSIGLGEDGPTHQPIEHLASLRSIPNLTVIRPADAAETAIAWLAALENSSGPTALALTRQAVPTIDRARYAPAIGLRRGAYILEDLGSDEAEVILMASGSEVGLVLAAGEMLSKAGIGVRIVSFPSWELFDRQPLPYQMQVLPTAVRARVAVEAGVPQGWERWVGESGIVVGIQRFGASAPYDEIYRHFGLTADDVVGAAHKSLAKVRSKEVSP